MESPLEHIKVVELATMAAAPMAGRFLAEWGAEVIHVEHPVTGDPWRGWLTQAGNELPPETEYSFWENYNRNKKSVTLDMTQDKGMEAFLKLVEGADVFLTNRRPYALKKFNLEYDSLRKLNPKIIYASLTGYGRKGPDKDAPGLDTLAFWARSGFMYLLQQGDMAPPSAGYRAVAAGDKINAIALACGIILAILTRERSGIGQEVDVSLLHTGIYALAPLVLNLGNIEQIFETDEEYEQHLHRERDEVSPLYISYETRDKRWLQLSLSPPDPYWKAFCWVIEMEELEKDPRFASTEGRVENQPALFRLLEEVFRKKTLAKWKERFDQVDMLWSPIQNPREVINDPQVRANGIIKPFEHPAFGRIEVVANPITLSRTPATIRTPAPEFSEHTEEVLLDLGYSWDDINEFKDEGVIA
ncbi:MAG: CoA transferase [Deltaproteobacteria bacterium]|nr:CoA transferase [Deltaproteobacteria bacterium]